MTALRCCCLALVVGCAPGSAPSDTVPADEAPHGGGLDESEGGVDEPLPDWAEHEDVLVDDALHEAVLGALQGAEHEVRVAQYTIWDGGPVDELVAALGEAAARGVAVWVLADETATGVEGVLAELEAVGAAAQLDSPERTTHNKLWIIDDEAYSGSHNLSWSALETNREASLRVGEPEAVAALRDWFDGLWADPAALQPVATAGVATDTAAFGAFRDCLDGAEERVRLVMYAVAWDERYPGSTVDLLLGAVEEASARGVDVQVLLDDSEWIRDNGINDAAEARLVAAGVPLRRTHTSEVVHAKALVCDDRALVSDANWSYSGLELYHGATVSRDDPEVAQALADWMQGLWEQGREP
jgi:phosphatidylserine/phosphatidylglycerophosphate/cardiolipin synthase-like enzyme